MQKTLTETDTTTQIADKIILERCRKIALARYDLLKKGRVSIFKTNILPYFKDSKLNDLDLDTVLEFYEWLKSKRLSDLRTKNTMALLNQLLHYFQDLGVIDKRCEFKVQRIGSRKTKERYMNKLKLAKQAQKLYEIENLNAQEIADKIGVSRRTVFNWITRFNWKKHKIDMDEIERTFPIELQEMVSKMMLKMTSDIDNNRKVSSEELYTIANIAQYLDKIEKQDQRKQRFVKPEFKSSDTLSDEAITQIRREFLGIDD